MYINLNDYLDADTQESWLEALNHTSKRIRSIAVDHLDIMLVHKALKNTSEVIRRKALRRLKIYSTYRSWSR